MNKPMETECKSTVHAELIARLRHANKYPSQVSSWRDLVMEAAAALESSPSGTERWQQIAWILGMRVLQSDLALDDEEMAARDTAIAGYRGSLMASKQK